MVRDDITAYCQERGFKVGKIVNNRRSTLYYITKDGESFVLKRPLTSETESAESKFMNEIGCLKTIATMNNDDVHLPRIVDINEKDQFYVSEYIEGTALNLLLKKPDSKAHALTDIYDKLFRWLHRFYSHYGVNNDFPNTNLSASSGPYYRKADEILRERQLKSVLDGLFKKYLLPVSMVHGDLVPWNILIDRDDRIYIFDWGNSGIDYPALDLARYLLQSIRMIYPRKRGKDIIGLFWKSFSSFFGHSREALKISLLYQYKYSMKILDKKAEGIQPVKTSRKFLIKIHMYLTYRYIISQINKGDSSFVCATIREK